jgi:hypothetical protein
MPQVQHDHPGAEELAAFGLGRLDDQTSAAVEAHLAGCEACRTVVERLPDDSLIGLVRSPASPVGTTAGLAADDTLTSPALPPGLAEHARYRVEQLLGVGGMGAVYRARHLLMERTVALKVINRNLVGNPAAVDRFRREMRAAAQLAHPNIVTAHDAEQAGDTHFLVMEYVEGRSLARLLADNGPLPVAQACDCVRQAALGLQHAFEQGMVHRDLKPHNLILTPGGQVKILDFGLARFVVESIAPGAEAEARIAADQHQTAPERLTEVGTVMGTPDYIAPEQARNAHAADVRADIYSLGCTLYELLAGRPPFPDGTPLEKVMAHLDRKTAPVTAVRPEVPGEVAGIVERMLAKEPGQRYQTPAEVAAALAPHSGHAVRRRRWLLPAAAVVLASVLLLAGYLAGWGGRHAVEDAAQQQGPPADPVPGPQKPTPPEAMITSPDARVVTTPAGEVIGRHPEGVWAVAVSPDGPRALSAGSEGTVKLWDLETGQELRTLRGHKKRVEAIVFLPDGGRALSGGVDKTLRLWDLDTGSELKQLPGHDNIVTSVAVSADGRRAVSGGVDRTVRVWDLDKGKLIRRFADHQDWSYRVCLSADGRLALSGSPDGTVRLRDLETGKAVVFKPGKPVWSVAFSPDGKQVLAGVGGQWIKGDWVRGEDNRVYVWDAASGKELGHFTGHTDAVLCIAFAPDGKRILTAGTDKTVRLWDAATREEQFRCTGHTDRVAGVAFTPDGRALSGSWDKTVRLWRFPH